ncbi:MAG: heparan-alpha-glucosaminide N-acetyltransferase domain-containing protein [Cyclobacteriaceae bacterium]|jgi:predicted acyltransferase|nr:heparan-alpha-glucosaminide N-acetyltransferase domain-containing protein [Cyclobacteriaceae bacterium]
MKTELSNRLISLDALRGFTIAGMVIVNDPGSWSHVYAPLLHAEWNGITPTDYIFPTFLFIVGVSIALAYDKRVKANEPKSDMLKKMLWRGVKIYLLGLFLWLWPEFDFSGIRWAGVLQRISVVFVACGLLFLYTDWKQQLKLAVGILVGYWIVMAYVPVPGIGFPDLSVPEKNWANYLDTLLLPGVMWQKTWDPEGLLSTLPSIATGIFGMLIGRIILDENDAYKKLTWLFFWGVAMLTIGGVWDWFFPINKNLWTSSYTVYMAGLTTLGLGAMILIVDMLGYHKWTSLGRIYGANAITAYVLAGMLTVVFYGMEIGGKSLNNHWMDSLSGAGASLKFASFTYAVLYMLIVFIPVWVLYKKKIFIKV